jgi:small subunit ribosomal protein S17
METTTKIIRRKRLEGTVMSDKMKDTAVVQVERFIKHAKYQKYLNSRKRYKVHDEGNTAKIGDKVVIEETRPISRHKNFKIVEIKK